ncbi:unnamed protein product [Rotaria sp. Silwood2]|nr:unnamed protein product [Rotaria sp. Silwood2]CAF3310121.1 unnamed protein product [Rotaria sp. Silwood2]
MQAGVVYEATCPQCEVHYIGKTFRHFKTRVHEHLNYQKQDVCFKKIEKSKHTVKRPRSIIKTPIERKGPITRSQTGKLPTRTIQTTQEDIGKLVKNPEILEKRIRQQTPKTAIAKHYDTTGHIFSNNDFAIRLKESCFTICNSLNNYYFHVCVYTLYYCNILDLFKSDINGIVCSSGYV